MLAVGLGAMLVLSCSEREETASAEGACDKAFTLSERGPVKVTVEVAPREPRLSDNPTFTMTIDLVMPPFGESLGDFLIRGFRDALPETRGKKRIMRRIYELEPVRTGEHLIHPIVVDFTDNRKDGDGKEHTIETEGLTITVQSVLGEAIPSLADLKPPEPPKELPPESIDPLWIGAGLSAVLAFLVVLFVIRRRRVAGPEKPTLSPRELAWLELEKLLEAGYVERDEFQVYYRELTGVVRRFIERTSGIRAYEQTTEEFLREAGMGDVFQINEREKLKNFLGAADLVKFAAMRPGKKEIELSFNSAKDFLSIGGGA